MTGNDICDDTAVFMFFPCSELKVLPGPILCVGTTFNVDGGTAVELLTALALVLFVVVEALDDAEAAAVLAFLLAPPLRCEPELFLEFDFTL